MRISGTYMHIDSLTVGEPSVYDLFDHEGKLLLARGKCVTDRIYQLLLERRVFRLVQSEYQPVEAKRFSSKIYKEVLNSIQLMYYEAALINTDQLAKTLESVDLLIGELDSYPKTFIDLNALRSYDNNLYVHSVNVAILAGMIGVELNLSKQQIRELVLGGLLHDLGKLSIPKQILNKPESLSIDEFSQIKQHPEKGVEMLINVTISTTVLNIVRHHHERWDGTGYPFGLKEKQNTLESQIVAVADIFDAVTADRPYRKSLPFYQACEIVITNQGLNPQAVEAFKRCIIFYPETSLVTLNSGEIGQVVFVPRNYPTRPTVRILYLADGTPAGDNYTVNLLNDLTKFITDVKF